MSTRAINSEDSGAAAELIRLVKERPNDLIDPWPPEREMEVLVDMGARGKGETTHARVAVDDTLIVGYGAIDVSPWMRWGQLIGPVIHPAHRKKGHGRTLLGDLIDQARAGGMKHVRGTIGTRNGAGHALLTTAGFKQTVKHTCLRLSRPPNFPELEVEDIAVERVGEEHGDEYFAYTQRLVPRQPRQTRSLLKTQEYAALLAFKGKKRRAVGCVEVDMRYGDTATVENLDTEPALLHKGLGNVLLSHAVRTAFDNESVQFLELVMAGTDKERIDGLTQHGFDVRHELFSYELKL